MLLNRCNGVVVRASALQSVDLGFISLVRSCQNTLENHICCFPTGRLVRKEWRRDEAVECACCVYGQGLPKVSTTYRLVTICTLLTPATLRINNVPASNDLYIAYPGNATYQQRTG